VVRVGDAAFSALANPATAMQQAATYGCGLNWYPVEGVGLLLDFSRTLYTSFGGATARPDETSLLGRLELHL
jgi:hypothetical protein